MLKRRIFLCILFEHRKVYLILRLYRQQLIQQLYVQPHGIFYGSQYRYKLLLCNGEFKAVVIAGKASLCIGQLHRLFVYIYINMRIQPVSLAHQLNRAAALNGHNAVRHALQLRLQTEAVFIVCIISSNQCIRHLRRIGIFARDIRSERSIRYPGNFRRYARRLARHGYSVNGKPLIVKAAGKLIAADVRFKHRLTVYIGQAVYGLQHTVRTY